MGLGKVINVNVIANAGAVGRGIIRAEDLDLRPLAKNGLQDERNEMRFRIVIFANLGIGAGAGGVEIAECSTGPAIGRRIIGQGALHGKFGPAVWINRSLGLVLR